VDEFIELARDDFQNSTFRNFGFEGFRGFLTGDANAEHARGGLGEGDRFLKGQAGTAGQEQLVEGFRPSVESYAT
jgi:hypothetical protein